MRRRTTRRDLTGQLLERERVGGFGRSVPFSGDVFPNAFHVSPWMSWSASSGSTPARTATTSPVSLGRLSNGVGADLDTVDFNLRLASGTWSFRVLYGKDADCGIFDLVLDGAVVANNTDGYNASATYNNVLNATGVAVASSGIHVLRFAVDGRHASATDYLFKINAVSGVRTGA